MLHKNCARCNGDLYVERGSGYTELVCLQCGYRKNVDERPAASVRAPVARTTSRRAA